MQIANNKVGIFHYTLKDEAGVVIEKGFIMQIANNKVGIFHYTLKDDAGVVIDSSDGKAPLAYIHGNNSLIPGMEKALEGKSAGDKLSTVIPPEEAYGPVNEQLINDVPLANFPEKEAVQVGAQFKADTPEGTRIATVMKIENETVTVNFNHQLAGETLHFDIEVVEVREPTAEELSHGHIHGEGGCNH